MSSSLYVSILYDGYVCISHRLLLLKEQIQQINFNEVLLLDKQKYYRVTIRFSSFHTAGLFLYPLKAFENLLFLIFSRCVKTSGFWSFQGVWKETSGMQWAKTILLATFK